MRVALALGGADCLHDDVSNVPIPFHGVVACNDAGCEWRGRLDAWVSLHAEKMNEWEAERERRGYAPALKTFAHVNRTDRNDIITRWQMPNVRDGFSSGGFAVKVALMDLKFDRVILCGIPMEVRPHFFGGEPWTPALNARKPWEKIAPEYRARMRSMSGWTRELLGSPEDWI